ncbi:hypothetical protein ACFYU9_21100 [Streptomyces sp. NPDC004327]|uniref:hypothetical protein n=1 Tax=Streptomyces sp. NPDC004327 TaxID=3364699 RepID=UPI0036BEDAF4
MKKYLVAAAVVAAAALTATPALAATSATRAAAFATPAVAAAAAPHAAEPAVAAAPVSAVRVVRSGERVDAGGGFTVWLTPDGKHWAGADGFENFRSVVDGNIDPSQPGVSHQSEGDATGSFHSGLYYGTRKAGKVVLTGADGRKTTATLLELPGHPGWGVWYAHRDGSSKGVGVALYDRNGRLLTELPPF